MQSRKLIIGLVGISCIAAVGCSSNKPRHPEIKEEFSTRITEDGSKLFTYTATLPERKGKQRNMGPPPGGGQGRGGPPPGESSSGKGGKNGKSDPLTQGIDNKLAETGYCREGYFTWEKTISRGTLTVNGECREAATDEDRRVFAKS
jgi:hypothetical protein